MPTTETDWAVLQVEALTRRESQMLGFLAEGYSRQEIAIQLTLGLASVKFHIQHLYGKLGVNSKRQALNRAKELGLLETPFNATALESPRPASGRPRHNLPPQLTNFIGRAQQVGDVRQRLQSTRLLTLTGPGGTGKTRLALEAAKESLGDFLNGAWLVELAPIAEPAQLPQAVAQALALQTEVAGPFEATLMGYSGRDGLSLVLKYLSDKRVLLIMDNCESLVQACAELAVRLLRAAPGLHIMATSREALGIAGEISYPVPPLAVPESGKLPKLDVVAQSEAVRLFVERAQAVRPDFALIDENASAVVEICQRLDGIPLAIELAAARVRALAPEEIADHLDDRFRLLTGGSRTAPIRQQTLRGAIDWSYELLADEERALLRRLTVFAGNWTLEAAKHVAGGPDVVDLLSQLVGKSLVVSSQSPRQETRFSLLASVREYAQEKLVEAAESDSARSRHLAFYLALAEAAETELRGHDQVHWVNRLDRETDNMRAALAWAIKTKDPESAQRLAGALNYYWWIRRYFEEARGWLKATLHLSSSRFEPSDWLARALLSAGMQGEEEPSESQRRVEQALAMYRQLEDKAGMAHALFWLGRQHIRVHEDYTAALEKYQQALDLWMVAEDGWGVGVCLHLMGQAAEHLGDRARARQLCRRSLELLREEGDLWQLIWLLWDLARQCWSDGDAGQARRMLEENLAGYIALDSQGNIVNSLGNLASISAAQGDYAQTRHLAQLMSKTTYSDASPTRLTYLGDVDYLEGHLAEASQRLEAALEEWREKNDLKGQAWPLARLGCVAYRLGQLEQSARLLEQSLTYLGPDGWWSIRAMVLLAQADVARVRDEHEKAALVYGRSLRIVMQENSPPDMSERFEGFAKLAALAAQPQRAARLFGAAEALRERVGTPIPPVERPDHDGAVALVRSQFDQVAFSAAWAEGRTLSWEQAAAYALET